MTPLTFQDVIRIQYNMTNNLYELLYYKKKMIQYELAQEIQKNIRLQKEIKNRQSECFTKIECKSAQSSESEFSQYSEEQSIQNYRHKSKKLKRKNKNDTKNIPKNFGKAIITFIEQNQELVRKVLSIRGSSYDSFLQILKSKKRNLHSIAEIRGLWMESQFKYATQMRTLSLFFLKKSCLGYIFGSRISNYSGHIKYRNRFIQVLSNPKDFTSIKT